MNKPTQDLVKVHNGESVQRERAPLPDAEEKRRRKAVKAEDAAIAMAEHNAREDAKRANMERLKAERLQRDQK